ncbi:MAG: dethiobiotin synthase [Bacteroidia bacterium]
MKRYFITGIGTDVGKTVASAIVVEALKADYWKPVQAGDLGNTDTMKVKGLVSNVQSQFHKEAYRFTQPMSPHAAAAADGVQIDTKKLILPETSNTLIIEGAGGLMVPLKKNFLVIDLIQQLKAEVILVSRNYLGSINHTLLSADALKNRGIPVAGIVFNGAPTPSSEEYILNSTGYKCILRIGEENTIDQATIKRYAALLALK